LRGRRCDGAPREGPLRSLVMRRALLALAFLTACSAPSAEQASKPEAGHVAETASTRAQVGDPIEGRRVATRVGCFCCHGEHLQGTKLWGRAGRFQVWSADITEKPSSTTTKPSSGCCAPVAPTTVIALSTCPY